MHVPHRWLERARWLEYGLLAIGVTLAAWSIVNWMQLQYFAHLPVPTEVSAPRLPGDPGDPRSEPSSAAAVSVARGTWVARRGIL